MDQIIFVVQRGDASIIQRTNVIVSATDRENAKRYSRDVLGGDPDKYIVTPVTNPGANTIFIIDAK